MMMMIMMMMMMMNVFSSHDVYIVSRVQGFMIIVFGQTDIKQLSRKLLLVL